jgi:hypothetical protein
LVCDFSTAEALANNVKKKLGSFGATAERYYNKFSQFREFLKPTFEVLGRLLFAVRSRDASVRR